MALNVGSKLSAVLGVTLIVVLLDLLLMFYVTAHGFAPVNGLSIRGVSVQLQLLPLLGVLVLAVAASADAFTRIMPRWLGPESDPMARLRFVRVFAFALVGFVCLLYIPFLLGSNWFWLHLSHASHVIGQLQGFGMWLENLEMPILALSSVWQYSIIQVIASATIVLFAWALARPARRQKRLR